MCDVTDPIPTAGHTENTACSTVAGAYRDYRAIALQHVDQIHHTILKENYLLQKIGTRIKCGNNCASKGGCITWKNIYFRNMKVSCIVFGHALMI
jgi:hypothetical protein